MKVLFTFLLTLLGISAFAQKFHQSSFIDPEIRALYDEGEKCLKIPKKDCREIYTKAIALGKKKKVDYMDFLYFQLGYYYDVRTQYDSTFYYTKKAYELSDKNKPTSAYRFIVNSLGAAYYRKAEYDSAAHYMLLTVKIEEEKNDKPLYLGYAYNNLGSVLGITDDQAEALKYYQKGYNLMKKIGDTTVIVALAANSALSLKKLKRLDEAEQWSKISLELADRYKNHNSYGYASITLANTSKNMNDAITYLERAIEKARTNGLNDMLGDVLDVYALKLSQIGKHQQAIAANEEAIKLHKEANYTTGLLSAYYNAGTIYYNAGNYKLSSEYFQKYNDLYESTIPDENKKKIKELNTKYETEKKERRIAEQELAIQKKNEQIRNWSIIGGLFLLGSLIYLYQIRKSQRQKLALLKQENENAMLKAIMNSEEQERRNISSTLHDSVAAKLGAAKMSMQSIPFLAEEKKSEQLEKTAQLISNIHQDIRNLAHHLLPVTLEKEGLVLAIIEFVAEINQLHLLEIKIDNRLSADFSLPKTNELILYRIVQELINNIVKHSKATEATVFLSNTHQQLTVQVSDNGIGFTTNQENQGLYSIRERISTIGGTFDMGSEAQTGTIVKLILKI